MSKTIRTGWPHMELGVAVLQPASYDGTRQGAADSRTAFSRAAGKRTREAIGCGQAICLGISAVSPPERFSSAHLSRCEVVLIPTFKRSQDFADVLLPTDFGKGTDHPGTNRRGLRGNIWSSYFSTRFLPHGTCYLWDPKIVWLHVISDGVITLAYYCIPLALIYLVRRRRDLPFNWIFWMFGMFILGCGTTHLMEIWTVWHPTCFLAGVVKAITAVIAVCDSSSTDSADP
jgi:hypothetical protein